MEIQAQMRVRSPALYQPFLRLVTVASLLEAIAMPLAPRDSSINTQSKRLLARPQV